MLSEADKDAISEKISTLFQGLELTEVADVLKIQLAMLVTQGADDEEGAIEFLDEITDDVEDIIKGYPFGEEDELDEGEGADPEPTKPL
jgi:hypothetical protein